jgi:hypothetical protein
MTDARIIRRAHGVDSAPLTDSSRRTLTLVRAVGDDAPALDAVSFESTYIAPVISLVAYRTEKRVQDFHHQIEARGPPWR